MINVDQINNGFVLDHIQAGRAMAIYKYLGLDKLDYQVAIIKNARSAVMGKKDIIKVEGPLDIVDFDVLGFIYLKHYFRYNYNHILFFYALVYLYHFLLSELLLLLFFVS